ncbi:MAG: Cytosine-specific methyltransferase [Candidatus Daviesbacteria bacterium GW2011_GWB1_41_5]|uniref:Cytosine-specific methyltransferase n=1 Tax=Candidatus Daviesbacteria bacterium GW2011_GWB1_41_5 TaxID=1618429 RepID=A0A0G0WE85_9BACT|nr:MAG: Cytosine-specific methyltransferase [Candidatus Daviesbacteria bacterium GW2011_GWB1_41_5]
MVSTQLPVKRTLRNSRPLSATTQPAYFSETKKFDRSLDGPTFVDLFSGAGGLTLGFEQEGFSNLFSIDNEPSFCDTYRKNFSTHTLIQTDIATLTPKKMLDMLNGRKVDVIVGGSPCQGFSMAGSIGRKFIDDPRNHLFKEFARVVKVLKPNYFVMENVARLYTHNKGKTREEIISHFKKLGYHVFCLVLNTADYGVPQMRRRVLFIGSKSEIQIDFSKEKLNVHRTVKDVIGDLPILKTGEVSSVANHEAMNHSKQMLKKMSYIVDGGDRFSIPSRSRPKSGDVRKYIRYRSDQPSVCVTGDMRKIFHYSQNRALTVRELARLQSFPDHFVFTGSKISQQQQVGNAVPPLFARVIGRVLKQVMQNATT